MLILTRKIGETLIIGDDITVTVLGVKGNQVRIGVEAPKDVQVNREEIQRKIDQEKANGVGSGEIRRKNESATTIGGKVGEYELLRDDVTPDKIKVKKGTRFNVTRQKDQSVYVKFGLGIEYWAHSSWLSEYAKKAEVAF